MPKTVKICLVCLLTIITLTATLFVALNYCLSYVSSRTNQSGDQLVKNIYSAYQNNSYLNQSTINFLILGLDPRDDQLEKSTATDTIIFASLNPKLSHLTLIPLPRDLWFYPLATKINQIYSYSLKQESDQFDYIQDNFSKLLDQKIDHTIILATQDLIDFVTLIGGVDVNLENGFIDTQFPNPEYIKNPSPYIPTYITINFDSGLNHLDKSNVSHFVRSRKNAPTSSTGGTDIGRIERQLILIEAISNKIKSRSFISQPDNLIKLYNFFHQNLQSNITDQHIYSLLFLLKQKILNLNIKKTNIPTGEDPQTDILYYPGYLYQKQWVFLPQDQGYQSLQQFVADSL